MFLRIIFVFFTIIFIKGVKNQLALEKTACDLKARNESCVAGFCCVRDEFLFSETLCRPLGKAGDACSTKETEFECPCETGFRCASNIHGHVTSLFGKCYPIPGQSPDTTPNYMTTDDNSGITMETTTAYSNQDNSAPTKEHSKPYQLDGDGIVG